MENSFGQGSPAGRQGLFIDNTQFGDRLIGWVNPVRKPAPFRDKSLTGQGILSNGVKNVKKKGAAKMAVERIVVSALEVEDAPGSGYKLLSELAVADVDLRCAAGFSADGGQGRIFLAAKNPQALEDYGERALLQLSSMAGLLLVGDDAVGAAAGAIKPLADAGISIQALTAVVCDEKYHLLIVVEAADADIAEKAL